MLPRSYFLNKKTFSQQLKNLELFVNGLKHLYKNIESVKVTLTLISEGVLDNNNFHLIAEYSFVSRSFTLIV